MITTNHCLLTLLGTGLCTGGVETIFGVSIGFALFMSMQIGGWDKHDNACVMSLFSSRLFLILLSPNFQWTPKYQQHKENGKRKL